MGNLTARLLSADGGTRMTEVVVFPQSGYANRMQAMASAAILADSIGAVWHVCWELQPVAPVSPLEIFESSLIADHFISSDEARARWGLSKAELPLYLTHDHVKRRTIVAGHDRGEQSLMPGLRQILQTEKPDTIAMVAGGKFDLHGDSVLTGPQASSFRRNRQAFYEELRFTSSIEDSAARAATQHGPFVGLHLRYSDRSLEAPWRHRIWPSLRGVLELADTEAVFIASDSARERDRWVTRLNDRGMSPWTIHPESVDRSNPLSAAGALVDWRILTRSSAMVYFSASSFAEEAAVASGAFDRSIGLAGSPSRALWVRGREYATAAATYPTRHGWWGATATER